MNNFTQTICTSSRNSFNKFVATFGFLLLFLMSSGSFGQAASATWLGTTDATATNSGNVTGANQVVGIGNTGASFSGTNGFSSQGWPTGAYSSAQTTYYQFAINPTTGNNLSVTSVSLQPSISGTPAGSATWAVYYSTSASFTSPIQIGTNTTVTSNTPATTTFSSLSIPVNNGNTIYLRFVAGSADASGRNIRVRNFVISGTTSASTPTYTSIVSGGDWNTAATWSVSTGGNGVPTAGSIVLVNTNVTAATTPVNQPSSITVNSGFTLTLNSIYTNPSTSTVTVNSGGTLAVGANFTNTGSTTVNGTFQINQGGFGGGAGTWTYGSSSTLIFNHTSGTYGQINAAHSYWPSTSGPVNVTVANNFTSPNGIDLGVPRTVTGVFQTAGSILLTSSATLTLNGIARINTGGSFANSPIYGNASTLIYNTGAAFGRGNEWTSATSGAGYPANVQISNPGTVTTLNMNTSSAQCSGNITIDASATLNTTSGGLTVLGNVISNGTISLGGDVTVQGNWTIGASGSQINNTRAVFFTAASGNQTITRTSGGIVFFDYLVINKAAGNVVLSSSPATSVTINTATGDVLQLLNAGALDLNGQTLTLNTNGGNIAANAAGRSITSGVTGATLVITGTKSISGAGTLIINTNVTTILSAGFDFSVSRVTINGILQFNGGGFAINGSAPIYANGSTLFFNTGGNYDMHNGTLDVAGWFRNVASTGSAQAGIPWNVTISNNTSVRYNTANTDIFPRHINGNLTINAGSTFTLGGLSGTAGDFFLRGNWTNSGTFNPNSRLVTFNGTLAQTLTGATTFNFLTLNNSTGLTLQASSPVTVTQTLALTSGAITIGANNLTVSGAITGASATNYVVTNSTGQLRRTVAASAIAFPVGNTAYNPITFNNSGTSDIYGVRVANTTPAGANPTKTVTRQWITTEAVANGSNLAVVAQYNTGETGAGFATSTDNFIGFYNGSSYIQAPATQAGANPFTVTSNSNLLLSDLTTGTQYFAIGRDNAFLSIPNRYAVTAITPASPTAGIGFSATVTSQDAYGAVTTLPSSSSFSLTSNGNAGTIAGTVTGTINSGSSSVVVTGIILPSAGTGATLTATNSSGLSLSPATSSSFNVLAAATQLAFVGVPSSGNVSVNLTSFNVEARRPDNSVDTTYNGSITIAKASGSGTLSGTLTVVAVNGVATFSTAQFNAADTYTLSATSGSLTAATSGNIVITLAAVSIFSNPIIGTNPNTSNPYTTGQTFNSNITVTGIGRGSGIGANNGNDRYNANGWTTAVSIDLNDYFQFTLTPNLGYYIDFNNLVYNAQASADGPTLFAVRSSLDGYVSNIATPTAGGGTISLSNTSFDNVTSAITFRIYGYSAVSAAGTFSVNDFDFVGNVICVQPTAFSVTGSGTACANTGVAVGLSGSQVGISYQLRNGATNVGAAVAGTGSAISFGNQTTAATYTVVASNTNSGCNLTTTMTGSAVVSINPIPTLDTISATPACAGTASTVTLTGLLPSTNGSFTYTNSYTGSFVYTVSGVSDASGNFTFSTPALPLIANGAVITITSGTVTATGCTTTFTGKTVTVVVNPILTASVSIAASATTICAGTSVTFTATPTNGGTTPAYQWQINGSDVSGQTASTFTTTTLNNNDAVTVILTSNASTCLMGSPATSNSISITVNPTSVAGTITGDAPVCTGTNSTTLTLTGNTGTIQWQSSSDNTVFNDLLGETSTTLTISNLTATTYYRAVVTSGVCPSATTSSVTVTVNPTSVAGTISGGGVSVCTGTNSTTLTLSGNTGTIQWQSSTDNVTFNNIVGQTASTYTALNINATTYYRAVVTSGACALATTTSVVINTNSNVGITSISASANPICSSATATLTANGVVGTNAVVTWWTGSGGTGTNLGTGTTIVVGPGNYYARVTGDCGAPQEANFFINTIAVPTYANLQFPGSGAICQGGTFTSFGQVYQLGVTEAAGAGSGITAEFGYNLSDTNPSNWTNWSAASFNVQSGNNDEYTYTFSPPASGTYYYTYRYRQGTCDWLYGGYSGSGGGFWNGTSNVSGVLTVNPILTASVSIAASATTICAGTSVTFTATPTNGGTTPAYQWQVNGSDVSGQTASMFTTTTLNNNDAVTVILTSNASPCLMGSPATSNTINITVNPILNASVSIAASATTICAGTSVTFTATPTNGGTTPAYQWQVNGSDVSGQTASTFTTTLNNNDAVTVILTSNASPCLMGSPATSNTINITVNPILTASVSIAASATTICAGTSVTFTATPTNGGTTPAYQWQVNGSDVSGQTASTFTTTTLNNNDAVTVILTSNASPCLMGSPATSNTINITVNPTSVGGTVSGGTTICSGSTSDVLTLTGNTGTVVRWESSVAPFTVWTTIANTNSTYTSGALTQTTQFRAVVQSGVCPEATSTPTTVSIITTTWNGTSWNNGTPNNTTSAIISGNLTINSDFQACTLTVNNNAVVTVNSGFNVTLEGKITVVTGATFTLSNNANLLQNSDVANTGNIRVRRNSSLLIRQDYTLWSSPVANQNLLAFSPNTLTNRFYKYVTNATPTPNVYVSVVPSTTSFAYGTGYLIRVPNNFPTTIATNWPGTFTGVPNNGPNSVSLINAGVGQRFNAIGNPYPSPIDMQQFVDDNASDITGTLYFWRKTNSTVTSPGYCTWTAGIFTTNNEAQVFDPNGVLRTGQGFIVEATSTGSTVQFNNGQRIADTANQFFRGKNNKSTPLARNTFWLNVTDGNQGFAQMAVDYNANATQGVDKYDGKYFADGTLSLNSTIASTDYVIQGRALPFIDTDVVPLSFKTQATGTYTISIDHMNGFFAAGQRIYLKDNTNNNLYDLQAASYSFTSNSGTFNNRFEIVYRDATATTVTTAQCGTTLNTIDQDIFANLVAGAQGYRFRVTDLSTSQVQTIDKALRVFKLTQLANYRFSTTYEIEVAVKKNNTWQPFGTSCTITTPTATTTVQTSQCGSTLTAMTDVIYANNVLFSSGYRFRVINLLTSDVQVLDRVLREFRMNLLVNPQFNAQYSVEVAVKNTDGTYLPYGPICTINTPLFPTTSLQNAQCDYTAVSANETIYANSYSGATIYRFRFVNTGLGYTYTFDRPIRSFVLNTVAGLLPASTYSVQVSLEINGVFGPYGKVCSITTPSSVARTIAKDDASSPFKATASPNPYDNAFNINVATSSDSIIEVRVYDMIGKLIETQKVEATAISTLQIGERYPSGVYNVIVSQGNQVQNVRVIKR